MSLKNAIVRLFSRKKREQQDSIRRDSDRIDEAQKQCARASLNQSRAVDHLRETLLVSETLHAAVRSKMPTRKIVRPDESDDTGTASLA